MKLNKIKLALCGLIGIGMVASSQAQTLKYNWNINNASGTGAGLTIAPSGGNGTLGTLTPLANSGAAFSTPAGSGLSGGASDLGLVSATPYRSAAGVIGGTLGDLTSINTAGGFTVSLWFDLNASATSFGSLNGGALNARLFDIASTSAGDGDRLFFSLNTGTNIQVGVNTASTGPITTISPFGNLAASPATLTNNWIFVAVSYTTAAGGTANIFEGTQTGAATLVSTLTGVGNLAWDASGDVALVGNRGAGDRGLPGTIDNVSLYSGAGDLSFVDGVQNIPEPTTVAVLGLGSLAGILALRRRRN